MSNELPARPLERTVMPVRHGTDCKKVEHLGDGYLHRADDNGPYDVDGLVYCGRCHEWLGTKRTPHQVRGNRGSRPGGGDNCDGQAHDMTKTFNTQGDGHDEWLTPKWITDTLGPFELDPCSPGDRRPWDTATYHLSVENDGLNAPWFGRVWCNPPYGRETFKWLDKLASHGNGIALIFARTETKGFHRQVWDRAHSILFLEGRLAFHRVDGTSGDVANAPSCLIAYGNPNTERLRASGFAGKLVSLK